MHSPAGTEKVLPQTVPTQLEAYDCPKCLSKLKHYDFPSRELTNIFVHIVYIATQWLYKPVLLCSILLLLSVIVPLRHLQREMENQAALLTRIQQQMKNLDDDIKQNEGLMRRAQADQKLTKVTIFTSDKSVCLIESIEMMDLFMKFILIT